MSVNASSVESPVDTKILPVVSCTSSPGAVNAATCVAVPLEEMRLTALPDVLLTSVPLPLGSSNTLSSTPKPLTSVVVVHPVQSDASATVETDVGVGVGLAEAEALADAVPVAVDDGVAVGSGVGVAGGSDTSMTGGSEIVMTGAVDSCGAVAAGAAVVPAAHADNTCTPIETAKTLPQRRVSCGAIARSFDATREASASI